MKAALIIAAMLGVSAAGAFAQTTPTSPAPSAPATTAPAGVLNGDSPIEAIVASPAGHAALEKYIPEVIPHPAYEQFKSMSLRQLAPLAGGIITDEKIASVEAALKPAK